MLGCIIQARMGSSRLPGKVMMTIDEKKPLIYYVIKQLQYCKHLEKIVVATTQLGEDDVIVDYVSKIGIEFFRGNQKDVLDRYYQCAKKFTFSNIVRITSDNPLVDPEITDNVIEKFKNGSFDYISNIIHRTFPFGTEVEVFSFHALEKAWNHAQLPYDREHVTPFFYNKKNKFNILNIENNTNLSYLRYTVDNIEDLKLVRLIISNIKERPVLMKHILNLFSKQPELFNMNKNSNSKGK